MSERAARVLTVFGTVIVAAALSLAVGAAGAGAATRHIEVESAGPGPQQFDAVGVDQYGPKDPESVLVLMPGTSGGSGYFAPVARDLVKRNDGLAVWAIDRRSRVLEDTSRFEAALNGEITGAEAFDYYLGWLANGGQPADHYGFLDTSTVPFAKRWGMKVALQDARKVVKKAKSGGAEVFLGGHSLGASLTAAYAAWDFNGKAGFQGLSGIVLIDGGLLRPDRDFGVPEAEETLATLDDEPFLDLLGVGIPEAAGLFSEAGAILAKENPDGPATVLQGFPLLPSSLKPPVPATNEAAFAYAFDRDTSPDALALVHVNGGHLAASGNPRPWVDGNLTPASRVMDAFGREPNNGVEWFFPRRLSLDSAGANEMKQNAVADFLGLRLEHTNEIDVPIYAFQTDLSDGGVLAGAEQLVKRAKTKKSDSMLIDGDPRYSHLDPLLASPSKNKFAKTVTKFLQR